MAEEDSAPKGARPWREIKAEIAEERNPERVVQLLIELERALLEQQGPPITKKSSRWAMARTDAVHQDSLLIGPSAI